MGFIYRFCRETESNGIKSTFELVREYYVCTHMCAYVLCVVLVTNTDYSLRELCPVSLSNEHVLSGLRGENLTSCCYITNYL